MSYVLYNPQNKQYIAVYALPRPFSPRPAHIVYGSIEAAVDFATASEANEIRHRIYEHTHEPLEIQTRLVTTRIIRRPAHA